MPRSSIANGFAAVENQLMTKVLLIEDDSETAEEITAELADRGFEVEWSANGIEGLDKARSSRPDAMIVDRLLPGMDGLTIIEALRKDQVRTPVLVLSALGAVDDRVRGLRMGGDDYLTKPFAIVELVARVEALLRRPTESRETTLRVGPLELDLIERTARRGDRVIEALQLGVSGYLLKSTPASSLGLTLQAVMRGEPGVDHSLVKTLVAAVTRQAPMRRVAGDRPLTPREQQVAVLLGSGSSTREIAEALGVSAVTARRHISSLMGKLHVASRAAAIELIGR